jgi:hypothetical protein
MLRYLFFVAVLGKYHNHETGCQVIKLLFLPLVIYSFKNFVNNM